MFSATDNLLAWQSIIPAHQVDTSMQSQALQGAFKCVSVLLSWRHVAAVGPRGSSAPQKQKLWARQLILRVHVGGEVALILAQAASSHQHPQTPTHQQAASTDPKRASPAAQMQQIWLRRVTKHAQVREMSVHTLAFIHCLFQQLVIYFWFCQPRSIFAVLGSTSAFLPIISEVLQMIWSSFWQKRLFSVSFSEATRVKAEPTRVKTL